MRHSIRRRLSIACFGFAGLALVIAIPGPFGTVGYSGQSGSVVTSRGALVVRTDKDDSSGWILLSFDPRMTWWPEVSWEQSTRVVIPLWMPIALGVTAGLMLQPRLGRWRLALVFFLCAAFWAAFRTTCISGGWVYYRPQVFAGATDGMVVFGTHSTPISEQFCGLRTASPGRVRLFPFIESQPGQSLAGFPIWMLIVGNVLIGLGLGLWPRWRRWPSNCCRKCGYDLTGNVSGVCPECGTTRRCMSEDPILR